VPGNRPREELPPRDRRRHARRARAEAAGRASRRAHRADLEEDPLSPAQPSVRHCRVHLRRAGEKLVIRVTDDGRGGADATRGSGLAGLAERLAAMDGTFLVDSPAGGPTTVTAELPWRDGVPADRT
jgi:hypothetical protein